MYVLEIQDYTGRYRYATYVLKKESLKEADLLSMFVTGCLLGIELYPVVWAVDTVLTHYLIKELQSSSVYRRSFMAHNSEYYIIQFQWFMLRMKPTICDLIDYNWNRRVNIMLRERLEINNMFWWLSTLGGAFSALGDYSVNCAVTAGKISVNQFKLALRLGDPSIQARCRLYLALSLIQRKCFKYARLIIQDEYDKAKSYTIVDKRLVNMCKGIWAKLQYDHEMARRK